MACVAGSFVLGSPYDWPDCGYCTRRETLVETEREFEYVLQLLLLKKRFVDYSLYMHAFTL